MTCYKIDQYFEFQFSTKRFDTGAATDADSTPTYRVYEENNDTVIDSGNCSKRDDTNTTGYYLARAQMTSALGYEVGKKYFVRVAATVNSVSDAVLVGELRIISDKIWDTLYGGADTMEVDLVQVNGTSIAGTGTRVADGFVALLNIASPTFTLASVNQTGDSYGIVNSGTHGNAALKTLIDAVDNFVDTEIAAIISTLGTPAGVSLAADLVVIDDFVDALESRLTATRAGYLDNLSAGAVALEATSQTILTDTNELQTDWVNGGRLDLLIDAILADTNELQVDWANGGRLDNILDARASQASVDTIDDFLDTEVAAILAAVDTEIAAILTDTGTDIPATLSALFTTALAESYRVDGATGSVAEILYELLAHHSEATITGTSKRLNKIDGSTQAAILTLNSATTPTAVTRTT